MERQRDKKVQISEKHHHSYLQEKLYFMGYLLKYRKVLLKQLGFFVFLTQWERVCYSGTKKLPYLKKRKGSFIIIAYL